jgi:hypothetical protein
MKIDLLQPVVWSRDCFRSAGSGKLEFNRDVPVSTHPSRRFVSDLGEI